MSQATPNERTCPSPLRDDLKAYMDDELAPPARRRVRDHLRTCPTCAKELIMLQTTQTKIREELHEQVPSIGLHRRILTQIEASGIDDERLRRERARGGLIPRRYLPSAIALSTFITAVALYPMVAHLREKARQASLRPDQRIGLALLQYSQDYDEKFPANASTPAPKALPTWTAMITLQVKRPDPVADTILGWDCGVEEMSDGDAGQVTMSIVSKAPEVKRLLPRLKMLGKVDPRQIQITRALLAAHPTNDIDLTVQIIPEKTR